jgi:hypothetical protein
MPRSRRSSEDVVPSGPSSAHRYRLILLNDEPKEAEVETERELGLGDDVEVRGCRYEIVGLAWRKNREHLLCRRRSEARAADEPTVKEKAWWLAD